MNRRQFLYASGAAAAVIATGGGLFRQVGVEAVEPTPVVGMELIDAFGPDGTVYLRDEDRHSIVKRSPAGDEVWDIGGFSTTENGKFNAVRGLALSSAGDQLFVVDTGNNRVQIFTTAGAFVSQFGRSGTGDGQFRRPNDIAVDSTGQVFVTDDLNHRVQVFNSTGTFLRKFGALGTTGPALNGPVALAFHPDGTVHVVDAGNARVQIYAKTGDYVGSYGTYGTNLGQFQNPRSIAIDSSGRRFVADVMTGYVTVYPPAGNATERFVPDLGFGRLGEPINLAIMPGDRLYVTALPDAGPQTRFLPVMLTGSIG